MLKTLDLETLLDLILFEDAETANVRLEPYGLYAVILPDTNADIKKIGTDELMFSLARGETGAFVDILVPDLEEKDVAGAELTTAQEDYETAEIDIVQPVVQEAFVTSTSDERTVNNVMRHAYRVLNDDEKANMQKIKDMGLEFWNLIDSIGSDRELSNAKTRIEEAVMWAVKSISK